MPYHIDLKKITIDKYKEIIKSTELIPSWKIILENIDSNFETLKTQNVNNLEEILNTLKKKELIIKFAENSGIPQKYLEVLNRMTKGYKQKPNKIEDFPNLSDEVKNKLIALGIKNTQKIYDKIVSADKRKKLSEQSDIDIESIMLITRLTDLSRIRWVNHTFAYVLIEAGYDSAETVANSDPQEMYDKIKQLNDERQIYNAHIGLRDMKMVIDSANMLDFEVEY